MRRRGKGRCSQIPVSASLSSASLLAASPLPASHVSTCVLRLATPRHGLDRHRLVSNREAGPQRRFCRSLPALGALNCYYCRTPDSRVGHSPSLWQIIVALMCLAAQAVSANWAHIVLRWAPLRISRLPSPNLVCTFFPARSLALHALAAATLIALLGNN